MFGNVGWAELVILVVAALVILGPERLPGAMTSLARGLRTARDYVSGAQSQLRETIGPEFDELRGPIEEISKLRGLSPRAAITQHLFDGDDSLFTGRFDDDQTRPTDRPAATPPGPAAPQPGPAADPAAGRATTGPAEQNPAADPDSDGPARPAGPVFDPDAT